MHHLAMYQSSLNCVILSLCYCSSDSLKKGICLQNSKQLYWNFIIPLWPFSDWMVHVLNGHSETKIWAVALTLNLKINLKVRIENSHLHSVHSTINIATFNFRLKCMYWYEKSAKFGQATFHVRECLSTFKLVLKFEAGAIAQIMITEENWMGAQYMH